MKTSVKTRLIVICSLISIVLFVFIELLLYTSLSNDEMHEHIKLSKAMSDLVLSVNKANLRVLINESSVQEKRAPVHATSFLFEEFEKKWQSKELYFSNVSDNPVGRQRLANESQQRAINHFRKNSDAAMFFEKTLINKKEAYSYAVPVWVERYCLKCHGANNDNGSYTSFLYNIGDLAGVLSVIAPVNNPRNGIAILKDSLLIHFGILLLTIFASIMIIIFLIKDKIFGETVVNENLMIEKSSFLAGMAHEIRTPLSNIIGLGQFMLGSDIDQIYKKNIRAIIDSVDILAHSINLILDLDNLGTNRFVIDKINFSVNDMLEEIEKIFKFKAQNRVLEFKTEIDDSIPLHVMGDVTRIKQVIMILCGNSLKHTREGYIILSAKMLKLDSNGVKIEFDIKDTGVKFLDIERTDFSYKVSKKIIEALGGKIWANDLGEGENSVSFTVELVTDAIDCGNDGLILKSISGKEKVLLVEDDYFTQKIIIRMLNKIGILDIVTASNGIEAIEIFSKTNFDLIYMDCLMPELDGYDTTKRIRELESMSGSRTPIIALTANAYKEGIEKCYSVGMDIHCLKPVRPTTLQNVTFRALNLKNSKKLS